MAKKIAQRGIAVALVEYRLSLRDEQTGIIANQHPAHLHDVFAALRYLLLNQDSSSAPYSIDHVCLAGHSVGAWMISAALLDCDQAIPSGLPPCPSLGTSIERATIRSKIKAWIGLDGIYDVQSLLQEYPDYAGFVSQAFIDPKSEPLPSDNPASDERLKSVSLPAWPYNAAGDGEEGLPHVYIAHSKDDELLSFRQSIEAAQHFIEKLRVDRKTTQTTESHGSSSTKTVSHAPPFVNVDLTSLTVSHKASVLWNCTSEILLIPPTHRENIGQCWRRVILQSG